MMFDHADAALAWSIHSPSKDREERALAVKRAMEFAKFLDPDLLLMVLEEFAGQGHPAMWFTETVARERVGRLEEQRRVASEEHRRASEMVR